MSHFTVMVIGENVAKQLAPFDENLETPRYVRYTKEQLIEKEKASIKQYAETTYAKYLKDKEAFRKSAAYPEHIEYLEEIFPKKLNMSDEEIYKVAIDNYDPIDIGPNGEIYSDYNPNSQWDWYQIGGRWAGLLEVDKEKNYKLPNFSWGWSDEEKEKASDGTRTDSALKKDILNFDKVITYAFLKDGEWHNSGDMGWWGMSSNEKPDWENIIKELKESVNDDDLVTIVDCHI